MLDDELQWEETACNWCGSFEAQLIFEGPDRLEHLPGCFRLVRCSRCGLIRQNPRLAWASLQSYYPEGYISHPRLAKDEKNPIKRWDKRYGPWKRLRAVQRYQPGGRLLEVGCGSGQFLEEALRTGKWTVVGVEPSPHAASYARQRLGGQIYQGRFSEIDLAAESFDAIVLWNVLEHLESPVDDLRHAVRLLKAGGWLAFSIPNLDSLEARIFGPYWVGWDLPRHLYLFPRQALEEILDEVGLKVAEYRCISSSYSVLGLSLDFWAQSWGEDHPHLKASLLQVYNSLPMRALLVPLLWSLDRLKRSTLITVFAQKASVSTHGNVHGPDLS